MNDKYTISEISKFLNISKSTLRYYDSIDLCKPAYRDANTNYRYYDYHQLFQLNMIDKLKKLHMSLDQIKAHSRIKNVASLERLLIERKKLIRSELDELQEIDRQNEALLKKIELSGVIHTRAFFELRQIPKRYIYRLNLNFPGEDLYSYIKILYSSYIKNSSESAYSKGEVALEISLDNFTKKHFNIYNSIGFFVTNGASLKTGQLSVVNEGIYVVACHTGSYKTIEKTYKKLWQYLTENNFIILGNSIETSVINISMTNNPEEFLTEIQIPVKIKGNVIGLEEGALSQ